MDGLEGVSEEKYLLAALHLLKSSMNLDIDERLLAYTICQKKEDLLLEKRTEKKEFSLSEALEAFNKKTPLELFFTFTNLKTWKDFEELSALQVKIIQNYDSLEEVELGQSEELEQIVKDLKAMVSIKDKGTIAVTHEQWVKV